MTISKELFSAILAMDAYNRGYGAGISDGKGLKDAKGNDIDGLGETGKIGSATISHTLADAVLSDQAQSAGFYAISYDTDFGKVISYRGTDKYSDLWDALELAELGELILTDIPLAGNNDFDEPSVHLASQFYQSVNGALNNNNNDQDPNTPPPPKIKISTTGHSLGGALAGFVGAMHA
ncbi:MAG: hypothetical protein V3V02_00980 [Rhizobiaceae bacterium]